MKEKRRVQLDDMISSFREIWKYDIGFANHKAEIQSAVSE